MAVTGALAGCNGRECSLALLELNSDTDYRHVKENPVIQQLLFVPTAVPSTYEKIQLQ